jgi:hypothetical protein
VAQLYPRALGSLSVSSYGGGILTSLHTDRFTGPGVKAGFIISGRK